MVVVIYARALRHATQKVSILALSKAQSSAPYVLVQYNLNNFSLTIVFNLLKKHKTLLVWPTKVLRRLTMSSPSRRDKVMIWPTRENRLTLSIILFPTKKQQVHIALYKRRCLVAGMT